MAERVLTIQQLQVSFDTYAGEVQAVRGVDLYVDAGEVLAVVITIAIITIKKRRVPRTAEDMQFLPTLYDTVMTTAREWSATTKEDMNEVSREVKEFMLELGSDEEKAALLSRFVEEMGTVITLWGNEDHKQHYTDIRLVGIPVFSDDGTPKEKEIDRWVLRIRDNCQQFDLEKWQAVHSEEEKTFKAIHTVDQQAKESSYAYTLGLNYLFVTI